MAMSEKQDPGFSTGIRYGSLASNPMANSKRGGTSKDMDGNSFFSDSQQTGKASQKMREKRWYHDVADFANLLKSFIGTNYLSLAFGIKQAGIGLGIGGLFLVAALTAHCCHLIVKVKYHAIKVVMNKRRAMGASSPRHHSAEEKLMFRRLQRTMTYSDIGRVAFGKWGGRFVNIFLVITQVGFCMTYHIFIGSNIYSLISTANQETINHTQPGMGTIQQLGVLRQGHGDMSVLKKGQEDTNFLEKGILDLNHGLPNNQDGSHLLQSVALSSRTQKGNSIAIQEENSTSFPSPVYNISTQGTTSVDPSTTYHSSTPRPTEYHPLGGWLPPLALLVILPLPMFIGFTLFRNVRLMGFVSLLANGTMSAGYFVVVAYIIANFSLAEDLVWFKWATFPVFLGQAASSYEAIGTILSIESSMDGNHHRYPTCLYSVVGVFSSMLMLSAILGYLKYGEQTAQILVQNLPQTGALIIAVNAALITAVLLTYPLQVYPVIEILEQALFSEGSIFGPPRAKSLSKSSTTSLIYDERQPLLESQNDEENAPETYIGKEVPDSVATWKRNTFRVFVAIFIGGLAVVFKDVFAYVSAFVGALGSCPLAFILPCLFHIKLCGSQLPKGVIIKDITIIVIGTVIGVVSLVVVVLNVISEIKK